MPQQEKLNTPEDDSQETPEQEQVSDELKKMAEGAEMEPSDDVKVPSQYEGLSADVIEELWIVKEYADPEKTKSERKRRQEVIDMLRRKEKGN